VSTEDIISTFQKSNINVLALTKKLADGEGTIGKLMNSDSIYNNIIATTNSLKKASANAQNLIASLSDFSSKLNKKGTLANDLVSDTAVFKSLKATVFQLNNIADTAHVFINDLKTAGKNPKSPVGVLLHDEQTGSELKATISNLDSGSKKLDEDLEALQHNFLLRRYFKKKAKENEK
ncbi:MAG: MlaD family protein, partial [Bacteroidia bacterium]